MSRAVAVCHGPFGRVSIYELDRPLVVHAHREAHLIFYLDGVRSVVPVKGRQILIDHLCGVAVNPWEPHAFRPLYAGSGLFLVVYLRPEWLAAQGMAALGAPFFPTPELFVTRELALWRDRAIEMLLSSHRELDLSPILMALAQAASEQGSEPAGAAVHSSLLSPMDIRVQRACRLLEERFGAESALDRVAREAGLSRAHFFKLFRAHTGVTPSVFANTIRLDAALNRIATSGEHVTEISRRLGFSCQSVFTRFFTSHIGMAPSDYRRALRETGEPRRRVAHV